MQTSMMKPMGYLFSRRRSVVALLGGILAAMVMLLVATSGQSDAQKAAATPTRTTEVTRNSGEQPVTAETTLGLGQQIIAAGNVHSMALKKDGTVWAWGDNGWGELGQGDTLPWATSHYTPVQVKGLTGVVDIDVGANHSMALRSDGTVWAWGRNNYGQLGVGDTSNRSTPVKVHGEGNAGYLTDIVNVEAGDNQSFAVKSDGTVWGWGSNNYKQLGDGTKTERHSPVPLIGLYNNGRDVGELAGGYHHGLAIKDGKVWSWGSNDHGQLGTNSPMVDGYYAGPVNTGSGLTGVVTGVEAGMHHSLALTNGSVWSWGGNSYGQLGIGNKDDHTVPYQVRGAGDVGYLSGITEVAAGKFHSMAIKSDGSVWAWGQGWYGQLGINSNNPHTVPYQVHGVGNGQPPDNGLSGITDVAAGDYHSLAVKSDGTVYAWGDNDYGQLGINNRDDHQVPYQVHGPDNAGFLTDIGAPSASNPPGAEDPPPDAKSDVTGMGPANGATGVPRRTNVTATFSEEMDTSTLTRENFMLYEMSAKKGAIQITNVSVTPNTEGTKVTLDPYGTSGKALGKDTEYVAVVTTGVEDVAGNAMAAREFWRFETGSQMK